MTARILKPLWRLTIVALLLLSVVFYTLQITLVPASGDLGFSTNELIANAPSVTRHVGIVQEGSPAWQAGMRAGDELPLANVGRESRVALDAVLPGTEARYDVRRGTTTLPVRLIATANPPYRLTVPDAIRAFTIFCLLIFALLVVLRAWNTEHGPLIATILTVLVLDPAADRVPWAPPVANVAGATLFGNNGGIDAITTALTMLLPLVLAGQLTQWRSKSLRVATQCIAAYALFNAIYWPFGLYARYTGEAGYFAEFANAWLLNTLPFLAGPIALAIAMFTAPKESRQRLLWIFWGLVPFNLGVALINGVAALWPAWFAGTQFGLIAGSAFRVMELALPAALFYGVLVRRALDIGFVVNRVAVYSALSIVLVCLFIVLEYALSKVFLDTSRAASLAIQLGVALAIGLSARYLHQYVDRLVDRVLFAKRHADESALRRFAREAEAYTSAQALLDRAIDVIRERSQTRGAAIYVANDECAHAVRTNGNDFPKTVDADDELLVKLRRWNEPVDTHDAKTVFPDGMVFPMSARGKLLGALACETKTDSSAFDPDERESLLEVARGIAIALDAFSNGGTAAFSGLRDSMTSLGEKIDSLSRTLEGVSAESPVLQAGRMDR